jgi:serine protease Do
MHKKYLKHQIIAAVLLLAIAGYLPAEEPKPAAKPKPTQAELLSRITRDNAEVRNAGQVTLSYADVVQNILPCVVSISTYTKTKQGRMRGNMPSPEDLDQLPPLLREWLERQGQMPEAAPRGGRQRSPQQPQPSGLGSGVILTEDGFILTNNHVVADSDELKVKIGKFSKEYAAKVIGTDPATDVALIKVEATGLPHATFGDSSKLRVGDVVLAVGAPMGLEQSVTQGIVSAMGRTDVRIIHNKDQQGYENFIQTDAAINPGNSGGPLVDGLGRVVGMNTAIETQSGMFSGIGLAIPVNMALSIVADLLDDGKVERGFLGVAMSEVDPSVADLFGLKDETGVTVSEVRPGSPAEKAGFQGGDVIVSADGESVAAPSKLRLMVSSKRPGESVKFGVVRLNSQSKKPDHLELKATLGRLTPEALAAAGGGSSPGGKKPAGDSAGGFLKGVQVAPITEDLRKEYNIDASVASGLVVTDVAEDSNAFRTGLQAGDVILRVNNQPVKNMAEAKSNRGGSGDAVWLAVWHQGGTKYVVVKN